MAVRFAMYKEMSNEKRDREQRVKRKNVGAS